MWNGLTIAYSREYLIAFLKTGPSFECFVFFELSRFALDMFTIQKNRKHSPEKNNPAKKLKLENNENREEEDPKEDEDTILAEFSNPVPWQKIESEGLDCDYALLFSKEEADGLLRKLEQEVVYATGTKSTHLIPQKLYQYNENSCIAFVTGEEAQVQVFGKVYNIPRKQATYGDDGLEYTYSGVKRLACPWTPTLIYIRDAVTKTTGQTFNFVLVNR